MVDLQDILHVLSEVSRKDRRVGWRIPRFPGDAHGKFRVDIDPKVYAKLGEVADNLKLADLVNYKTAQAAFPKLVKAVQLVLAIADNPDSNPDVILLASKTRAQLESALKAAGEEYHSCSREPRI